MVTKSFIVAGLNALDLAYQHSMAADDAERFAKLAIIELCGWIEESMDDVIWRCAKRRLKVPGNLDLCEKDIIGRTYGFDYREHFRAMLIRLLGLVTVERLESQVDQPKHLTMKSTLGSLKVVRNTVAHTHLKGTTRTLDAPSVTIRSFQRVYDGLLDLDQTMRRAGW